MTAPDRFPFQSIRSTFYVTVLVLAVGVLTACSRGMTQPGQRAMEDGGVTSYADVQAVMDAKCTRCHAGADAAAGLQLDSWDHLVAGSDKGEAVVAFDPGHSLLYTLTTKLAGGPHPAEVDGEPLTDAEAATIADWITLGARSPAGTVPFADADNLLYVANQSAATVSVIDMDANVVIRTIDLQKLGFSEHAKPHHTAVEPDGSFWYVSLIAENTVLKFNRKNELVGRAPFEAPGLLALHPGRDLLLVGRSMAAVNPPKRIGFIKRSDMSIEEVDVFYPRPHPIAIDPRGDYAYSGSLAENRIGTVDLDAQSVDLTDVAGDQVKTFVQFAVTPDGKTLVSAAQMTGEVLFWDITDPTKPAYQTSVQVGSQPWHPSIGPDGRRLYVPVKESNSVAVIDLSDKSIVHTVTGNGLSQPHGSAVRPDGRYLYVSNNNLKGAYTPRYDLGDDAKPGTVVVIDTQTFDIVKILEVDPYAAGVSTRPLF